MEINELTLPNINEIKGFNGVAQLELFKRYGIQAKATDFARILGVTTENEFHYGCYFTSSISDSKEPLAISYDEKIMCYVACARYGGIRPQFKYPKNQLPKDLFESVKPYTDQVYLGTYGNYPQEVISLKDSQCLEERYQNQKLEEMPFNYIVDKATFKTYQYKDSKYVRAFTTWPTTDLILSNGVKVKRDMPIWIKVSPVRWLIDQNTQTAISEKILVSGVPYDRNMNAQVPFEKNWIYAYINRCLLKDLTKGDTKVKTYQK